jgi:hypothetical protein
MTINIINTPYAASTSVVRARQYCTNRLLSQWRPVKEPSGFWRLVNGIEKAPGYFRSKNDALNAAASL